MWRRGVPGSVISLPRGRSRWSSACSGLIRPVEGSHLPVVPMSVRLCARLWGGDGRAAAERPPFGRQPDPPKQVLGGPTRVPRRRLTAPGCCYPTTQVTAPVVCPSPRGRRAPESGNLDVLREEDLSPQPRSTDPETPAQPAGGSRGYSSSTLITSRFPKTGGPSHGAAAVGNRCAHCRRCDLGSARCADRSLAVALPHRAGRCCGRVPDGPAATPALATLNPEHRGSRPGPPAAHSPMPSSADRCSSSDRRSAPLLSQASAAPAPKESVGERLLTQRRAGASFWWDQALGTSSVPCFGGRDGCDDQGSDPVGPPPSQRVVQH